MILLNQSQHHNRYDIHQTPRPSRKSKSLQKYSPSNSKFLKNINFAFIKIKFVVSNYITFFTAYYKLHTHYIIVSMYHIYMMVLKQFEFKSVSNS